MNDTPNYLDPAILAGVKGLEFKARQIVEGFVSGLHRSPFHGFSAEFAQHREYVPGDDLRYVDWKVYGKSDRIYLKQFEEETNFACHLLVDSSESMAYQSDAAPLSKLEYAKCLAAALGWLIIQQHDAVGLATFDTAVQQIVRASNQPSHLKQLTHELEQASPIGDSDLAPVFHDLAERITHRGVIVIFSDLLDDPERMLRGLKHFRHRRHDVSVIHLVDPAEQDFPFVEETEFLGLEGMPDLLADPRGLRKAYQAEFENFCLEMRRGLRELGMHYQLARTDQHLDAALTAFLSNRARLAAGKG